MILEDFEKFLEKIDHYRDGLLFLFIKPYWPRKITPNHITWVRVILGLAFFVLLFWFGIENKALVLSLFGVGLITDLIDGPVARGTNRVTEFGAALDSTADRILIIPIAIYSLFSSHRWLLLVFILAEILNALTSIFYQSREIYLESNIFGKTKMFLLSIVFAAILIVWPETPPMFFIDIIWISLIFSILSIFSRIIELKDKGLIKNKIINKELNKLR